MTEATPAAASGAAAVAEAPGVWSIRVPFPDNPLGYTLVYALETTAGGPVLIDAGWDDPGSLAALERGLEAAGTSVSDVRGVLVTHHHPDHHGLAGRIRELSGCWVALHEEDAKVVEMVRSAERGPWTRRYKALLELCGAPAEAVASAAAAIPSGAKPAVPDVLIEDGALMDVPGRDAASDLDPRPLPRAHLLPPGGHRGAADRRPRPAGHHAGGHRLRRPRGRHLRPAGGLPRPRYRRCLGSRPPGPCRRTARRSTTSPAGPGRSPSTTRGGWSRSRDSWPSARRRCGASPRAWSGTRAGSGWTPSPGIWRSARPGRICGIWR